MSKKFVIICKKEFDNNDKKHSKLTGKRLKTVMQSAISDHLLQCNCTINFDDFDILATELNKFKLLLRESLLIKRDKPILSRTIKSFPLELFD